MEKMKIAALLLFAGAIHCDEDVNSTQSAYQDYVSYSQLCEKMMVDGGVARVQNMSAYMEQAKYAALNLSREASLCQGAGNCEQSPEFQRLLGELANAMFGSETLLEELQNLAEVKEQHRLLAKYKP